MFRYAQILNNKAHWIFESEETIDEMYSHRFSKDMVFIDITNNPEIQEGWDYVNNNFIEPQVNILSNEELLNIIRLKRNQLLAESDWTQLPDVQATLSEAKKEEWIIYRQQLRDMLDICDLLNPIYPQKP